MVQLLIAVLYGLAVLTFTGLSIVELWKSHQQKWIKFLGTVIFGTLGISIIGLTIWLVETFRDWQ